MKRCLRCDCRFSSQDWRCQACGWSPDRRDGFLCFAPDLAAHGDDFPADAHDILDKIQARSFWFRGRNDLITRIVAQYTGASRRILEIGCGTGYVLNAIAEAVPEAQLVGSEIYVNALGMASRRLSGRAELLQMDARYLPYREEFDLVCAFDVIEHIDDDMAVIVEMSRAAKRNGAIMITVPQHPFLWSAVDEVSGHKRRYRRNELADKCRAAGLEVVVNSSFVSALLPLMAMARLSRTPKQRPYARDLVPPSLVNSLFESTLNMESWLIAKGARFPFGGSTILLARKPAASGG
jgi:ubiquinone/menaquinone biosynthesis C-methylase UbiE